LRSRELSKEEEFDYVKFWDGVNTKRVKYNIELTDQVYLFQKYFEWLKRPFDGVYWALQSGQAEVYGWGCLFKS
jgi:hypothetical protein